MTAADDAADAAREKLLDLLRNRVRAPIERRADEILDSFVDDNEGLAAFQLARADLDQLIAHLEHANLKVLSRRLDSHRSELSSGIRDMTDSLKSAKSLTHSAELFATVVGVLARIVALA
ncbi:MAG: hypothetical protein ABR610_14135 [Thermoanaerobaculia bacterium]